MQRLRAEARPGHSRWANRIEQLRRDRSVILGYHGVGRAPFIKDLSRLNVSPSRFSAQLGLLVNAGPGRERLVGRRCNGRQIDPLALVAIVGLVG